MGLEIKGFHMEGDENCVRYSLRCRFRTEKKFYYGPKDVDYGYPTHDHP